MATLWGRYQNAIVGLTIMALMIVALVTSQAEVTSAASADTSRPAIEIRLIVEP